MALTNNDPAMKSWLNAKYDKKLDSFEARRLQKTKRVILIAVVTVAIVLLLGALL